MELGGGRDDEIPDDGLGGGRGGGLRRVCCENVDEELFCVPVEEGGEIYIVEVLLAGGISRMRLEVTYWLRGRILCARILRAWMSSSEVDLSRCRVACVSDQWLVLHKVSTETSLHLDIPEGDTGRGILGGEDDGEGDQSPKGEGHSCEVAEYILYSHKGRMHFGVEVDRNLLCSQVFKVATFL